MRVVHGFAVARLAVNRAVVHFFNEGSALGMAMQEANALLALFDEMTGGSLLGRWGFSGIC